MTDLPTSAATPEGDYETLPFARIQSDVKNLQLSILSLAFDSATNQVKAIIDQLRAVKFLTLDMEDVDEVLKLIDEYLKQVRTQMSGFRYASNVRNLIENLTSLEKEFLNHFHGLTTEQ